MESSQRTDRILAVGTVALTALWGLTALSFPVPARKLDPLAAVIITALAIGHAAVYWNADRLKARLGFVGYVAIQLAILFGVAATGAIFPFGLALLIAFTGRTVSDQGMIRAAAITGASFATFLLAAIVTSDLYRGATSGLLLAATGIVAYSIRLVIGRRMPEFDEQTVLASSMPPSTNGRARELTARELEVLRKVATGSRTSDVAGEMGISERTVKAHLTTIYQKLGVENRAAAIAVAMQARLL